MKSKPKVLLLTGAGFSSGFLSYNGRKLSTGFLTCLLTKKLVFEDFFELLSHDLTDKVTDKKRMNEIQDLCCEVYGKLASVISDVNFEHIIFALEKICDTNLGSEKMDSRNIEQTISAAVLTSEFKISYEDLHALNCFILDVVALFKREDEKVVSGNSIHPSIQKFKTTLDNDNTHHFTLNYDTCFYNSALLFSNSEPTEIIEHHFQNIKNYHLHGSVLFSRTGMFLNLKSNKNDATHARCRGSYFNYETSSNDEAYFFSSIIGLNKSSKLLNPMYDWMLQKLICEFYTADKLIIIGYSFNDPHINSVLKYAYSIESLKTIHIVDKKNKNKREPWHIYNSENDEFEGRVKDLFSPGKYQSHAPKEKPLDVELRFFSEEAEKYMESYELT